MYCAVLNLSVSVLSTLINLFFFGGVQVDFKSIWRRDTVDLEDNHETKKGEPVLPMWFFKDNIV